MECKEISRKQTDNQIQIILNISPTIADVSSEFPASKIIPKTENKKGLCSKCNMFYHPPEKCKIDQSKNICKNCGTLGHNSPSCPKLTCHKCGELGHYSDKCPY